jgi:hypothetical protein
MPFFKGSNNKIPENLQSSLNNASTQNFVDTEYYIQSIKNNDIGTPKNGSGPDDYGNFYNSSNATKLFISYVPNNGKQKYSLVFPAILDAYSEDFKPTFEQEQLYGRMDPVQKYKNTSRTINVSFKILAYDENHALKNLQALSTLSQFLYPVYTQDSSESLSNATFISQSPLWRVKFANMIQSTKINKNLSNNDYVDSGLLVAPTSFTFQPDLEMGFFISQKTFLFPKQIKLSLALTAIHESTLGWVSSNKVDFNFIGNINENNGNIDKNTKIFPWGDVTFLEGKVAAGDQADASDFTIDVQSGLSDVKDSIE